MKHKKHPITGVLLSVLFLFVIVIGFLVWWLQFFFGVGLGCGKLFKDWIGD